MPSYSAKWPTYAKEWDSMTIRPNKVASFNTIAKKLIANKERYLSVEKATSVPWFMVALLHMRESDNNFSTQLAQGDPLSRRSTHVPAGRGPFSTWEAGAYDALVTLKNFNKIIDWRLEKILYYSELYNGWGYSNHGVPSAYIWAGSSVYSGGKYISDGVWSPTAVDSQPGVAPVLKAMMALDPTINPKRETTGQEVTPHAGTAGAVVIGGTAATAAYPHLAVWIIPITAVVAIAAYFIVKHFTKETPNA